MITTLGIALIALILFLVAGQIRWSMRRECDRLNDGVPEVDQVPYSAVIEMLVFVVQLGAGVVIGMVITVAIGAAVELWMIMMFVFIVSIILLADSIVSRTYA